MQKVEVSGGNYLLQPHSDETDSSCEYLSLALVPTINNEDEVVAQKCF